MASYKKYVLVGVAAVVGLSSVTAHFVHKRSSDRRKSAKIRRAFTNIYKTEYWKHGKDVGGAGTGSTADVTEVYRNFLEKFMKENKISSVVDFGCGDWEFSRLIDWKGIDYTGIDVVEHVIEKNSQEYQTDHIHFMTVEGIHEELPKADLIVCKDVLQHLTNEDIFLFLKKASKFKHCLITNDFYSPFTIVPINADLEKRGYCKELDLTQPPFNCSGEKILTYEAEDGIIKQVFYLHH
ncbi:MAG: class I SAM-dependent methyltransferase [Chlamydiota bacterium]